MQNDTANTGKNPSQTLLALPCQSTDDASAKCFFDIADERGLSPGDIDFDLMVVWFANAIEVAHDVRMAESSKRENHSWLTQGSVVSYGSVVVSDLNSDEISAVSSIPIFPDECVPDGSHWLEIKIDNDSPDGEFRVRLIGT